MNTLQTPETYAEPTPEILRRYTWTGHLLVAATLALWTFMFIKVGAPYGETWWIIVSTIFFGPAAAVGSGLNMHFPAFYLFLVSVLTEIITVVYVLPIFVRNYYNLTRVPYIGNHLDNMHKVALSYKSRIAPYGVAGLIIFVIFPFWGTGPLVGAVVGYIIGLSLWLSVVSVALGAIMTAAAWTWFYDWLMNWNSSIAGALLVIIFAVVIGGVILSRIRKR